MANLHPVRTQKRIDEAMISLPLSALRYLSRYPREKKIVIEISTDAIKRVNAAETLDEIINEARLDYALGNYKTFTSAKDLIAELRS
jgi:ribosomal protein L28